MTGLIYWPGDGFIGHASGNLTASMAMGSLSRHLADSRKPFATPEEVKYAEACIEQITAAARVSFTAKPEAPMEDATPKQRRGFAAMDPAKRREIARKGGASVAPENRTYAKNRELAASAGKKGGEVSRGARRAAGGAS